MEDMKKQINYKLEKIKKELKTTMPLITDPNQQLTFLNQKLDEVYNLGLIQKNTGICNTIIKYYDAQREQEDLLEEPQKQMLKNMENIIDNMMKEL